jgi:transcriptional regulator with XRE-family HTH domain
MTMSKKDSGSTAYAARLRLARENAGLSQGQVAKILGLHRPSISEAEAGRRKVSTEELVELARIYGVSISWLAGTETKDNDPKIELAARELAKLRPEDLDRLLQLLRTMREEGDANT